MITRVFGFGKGYGGKKEKSGGQMVNGIVQNDFFAPGAVVCRGAGACQKRAAPFFDKRDFAPTRASVCASAHEHTLARHQPSGLPRPVPLGRGQRKVFFATYMPPQKMNQTLFAACGPRTLRGFLDSLWHRPGPPGGSQGGAGSGPDWQNFQILPIIFTKI